MDVVDVFNVVIIHAATAKDTELQISSPVQAICADIGVIWLFAIHVHTVGEQKCK